MSTVNGNTRIPAETVLAALADLDAGKTLKITGAKFGIAFSYLHMLRKNRLRRRDVQAWRPK